MTNSKDNRPVLLILHADGHIELPSAQTYGDALAAMSMVERAAALLREQLLGAPLQVTKPPEATP